MIAQEELPSSIPKLRFSPEQFLLGSVGGMAMAFILSRAVHAAARLGLCDLLGEHPLSAAELAAQSNTHEPSLLRLLTLLCEFGVLVRQGDGRFALTNLGRGLQSSSPYSQLDFVLSMGGDWQYRAWSDLLGSVRTGRSYFERVTGRGLFDYLAANPEQERLFENSMKAETAATAAALTTHCNVGGVRKIVDVGGGNGMLLAALLAANSSVDGVLFERPPCIAAARNRMADAQLQSRCSLLEGDFFTDLLPKADIYILKNVLHDWDDRRAIDILKNCRRAMQDSSRLLSVDLVIATEGMVLHETVIDLAMLLLTGGCERTEEHYRTLFASSGLRVERIIQTHTVYSVIEATPV
jgi:hypothetical protein